MLSRCLARSLLASIPIWHISHICCFCLFAPILRIILYPTTSPSAAASLLHESLHTILAIVFPLAFRSTCPAFYQSWFDTTCRAARHANLQALRTSLSSPAILALRHSYFSHTWSRRRAWQQTRALSLQFLARSCPARFWRSFLHTPVALFVFDPTR